MPQDRTFSCTFCFTNRTFGFIVSFIDNKRIVVRCKTFRWPGDIGRHEDSDYASRKTTHSKICT
ncbi:hypothetical protein DPK85_12115 [Salmonella enterica subsp. diarizonae]|nr:hypothetical protein [Salmonella enterica subsp. diarizonae]EDS6258641.1 hypothetical protein [Salmonella enterica subsp. diarizonae]